MLSDLPKVLHCAAGVPLVRHVLDAVEDIGITEIIVVIGRGSELVREALGAGYKFAVPGKAAGHRGCCAESHALPSRGM